jgi:S1-C subfamily serine protease
MGGSQSSSTYLGSIPDMSGGDVPGMRLSGIRAGSPADAGGLRAGDVIVEFAGAPVKDLYSYSDALYAHKPGDRVTIVFLRNGKQLTTSVTLGTRGR